MKLCVVLIFVFLLAVSCEGFRRYPVKEEKGCTTALANCPCGSVCVSHDRLGKSKICKSKYPRLCICRRGCQQFDKFIPAGKSKKVYCNTCSCPLNSALTKGIPACTRRRWCLPKGMKWNGRNQNCPQKG